MCHARNRSRLIVITVAAAGWVVAAGGLTVDGEPPLPVGPPPDPCPADIDDSGSVDTVDLLMLLSAWGACPEDLDGDGVTVAEGDCDDGNPQVYPGADELCDGIDNDCDLVVDEDPVDAPSWWPDLDSDGYGDSGAQPIEACLPPGPDYVDNDLDCDDTDASIYPGASWWPDLDSDGFGDAGTPPVEACLPPGPDYVDNGLDCDDTDASTYPNAREFCDGVDNSCDGTIDENPIDGIAWYPDFDGDGYGDANAAPDVACMPPAPDYVDNDLDCDDTSASTFPGARELCDGIDNNCDGEVDEGC